AFKQPLHAEADAEQRPQLANPRENRLDPRGTEGFRRAEMTDARHDDRVGGGEIVGPLRREQLRAERGKRFAHRREITRLVVDQRNHRRPLVLGSIFASRLSFATATRSARANALNTASMWWWLDRPYRTFTCTFARAPIANPSKKSWTSSVCRSPTFTSLTLRSTTACGRPPRSIAATAS